MENHHIKPSGPDFPCKNFTVGKLNNFPDGALLTPTLTNTTGISVLFV